MGRGFDGAAVEEDGPGGVAADEVAPAKDVVDGWPAVGVEWNGVAGRDGGVEDADGFVFENDGMVLRGGDDGVEVVGPVWLGWGGRHGFRFVGNCCRLKGMGQGWIAVICLR